MFHPSATAWFEEHFKAPTPAQTEAWPLIKAGRNVLIAAPTGSGKTLAAFMAAGSGSRATPLRTTPITILPRRHNGSWASLLPQMDGVRPSPRAQMVADWIRQNGASFFQDLMEGCGLLRYLDAGRWSLVRRTAAQADDGVIEHVARTLLRRSGVVFWRLIEREAAWLPPWRELLRVYRRLESRGEIRGGRFVAGFSGEQFALPDAIGKLRETRRQPNDDTWAAVSGSDPLNLAGILTAGPKIASLAGNRVLYRDGIPVAALAAGEVTFFNELDPATEWQARQLLLRAPVRPPAVAPEVSAITQKELVPTK